MRFVLAAVSAGCTRTERIGAARWPWGGRNRHVTFVVSSSIPRSTAATATWVLALERGLVIQMANCDEVRQFVFERKYP